MNFLRTISNLFLFNPLVSVGYLVMGVAFILLGEVFFGIIDFVLSFFIYRNYQALLYCRLKFKEKHYQHLMWHRYSDDEANVLADSLVYRFSPNIIWSTNQEEAVNNLVSISEIVEKDD